MTDYVRKTRGERPVLAICYDFESEEDGCVTIRFRDSMEQKRVKIEELVEFIRESQKF